jgi:DNA-binding response OmpR family regulator
MRVLIVEDEPQLANLIGRVLREHHYDVEITYDGTSGLELAFTGNFDAIVLDRMLPGLDGLSICKELRADGIDTPTLILSARGETFERVEGLDAGADDYLGKPFAFSELLARVRALTRRGERPMLPDVLRVGGVALNARTHSVTANQHEIVLSPREYALLEYLLRNVGNVLTRDQILERVWGYDADPESNSVDLYIHYVRRKLAAAGADNLIQTVRGAGYVIRDRP